MAQNAADHITYYLLTGMEHKDDLAGIRQWPNLKVGFEEDHIWVKDFDAVQIGSVETKSIPYKTLYYEKNGKLHLLNHLLPERAVPALLWSPIERALPIRLPSFNHNFFGIGETVMPGLVPANHENTVTAMKVPLDILQPYLETAPAWRLGALRWAVINKEFAFLAGTPLLPLNGNTFWQRGNIFLPAGYDLQYTSLTEAIDSRFNPGNDNWLVWEEDNTCLRLPKKSLQQLSRSSFRNTLQQNDINRPS